MSSRHPISSSCHIWPAFTGPGSTDAGGEQDFFEVYGGVGREYGAVAWEAKVSWSPDFYLEAGPAWYSQFGVSYQLAENLGIDAGAAMSRFDDSPAADYEDYQFGATTSAFGVDWDLRWHDTTVSDSRIVQSVSQSFGG